jgi:Fe2+ or Zn2+ uptake regulation protein
MPKIDYKHSAQQLQKIGLKVTPARLTLLSVLQTHRQPQTISDIKKQLKKTRIDLVTIYRNVELFAKIGIVKKALIRDNEAFYEYNSTHHHHLVCQSCGRIEDFEGCNTRNLIEKALKQSQYFNSIKEHSLELFGLCKTCAS